MEKKLRTVAAGFIAGVAFSAAAAGMASAEPKHGGTLSMVQPIEPPGLVSAVNTSTYLGTISTKIHEGLVQYDEALQPVPSLAEAWDISSDGLQYTFYLRKNVTWHDGEPFTADDVEFSLMKVWKQIHGRGRATFDKVTEVEKPDAHTIILRLSEASPMIMSALGSYESQVIPKHIYDGENIAQNPALNTPVGTGPFMFSEWRKGEYIRLVRNPEYWDQPKPYLDEIVLRIIPDGGARVAALESEEVLLGVFNPVALADIRRLSGTENLTVKETGYELLSPMYLMEFNLSNEHIEDPTVRRAIAHAIDKDFVIENIWFGFGKAATGPVVSNSPYYSDEGVPQYDFSVEQANELLDEAGYSRDDQGTRFTLTLESLRDPETLRTAEYIKQALGEVGIEVDLRNSDLGTYIHKVYSDYDFDMTLSFFSLLSDPSLGMERLYISSNIRQGTPFSNASQYRNPKVDNLLEAARTENDPEARYQQFHKVQRVIQEDLPVLNLFEMQFSSIANERIKNLTSDGEGPYSSFKEVYIAD